MMKILVFACIVLIIYAILNHNGVTARKPKMTPAVEELLIQEGDELRLSCQGESRLQFSAVKHMPLDVKQSKFTGSFDEGSNTYTFIRSKTIRGDTGWYACAEENVPIINDDLTIDHPGEEISWIYVYVNSSSPFIGGGYWIDNIYGWKGEPTVIPCRTTSPNLPVILRQDSFTPKMDYPPLEEAYYDPKIGFVLNEIPEVRGGFSCRCEINETYKSLHSYFWPKYFLSTTEKNSSYTFINVSVISKREIVTYEGELARFLIRIGTYPNVDELYWCNPDGIRVNYTEGGSRYVYERYGMDHTFYITEPVVEDSGNYTMYVSTTHNQTSLTFSLIVLGRKPEVSIEYPGRYLTSSQSANVTCFTTSRSIPNVTWRYMEYPDFPSTENTVYISPSNISREQMANDKSGFLLTSRLILTINTTSDVICSSCNVNGCNEYTRRFLVSDIAEGFGIVGPEIVTEGDDVDLTCGASVYDFTDRMTWIKSGISSASEMPLPFGFSQEKIRITKNQTKFTFQSVLRIRNVRAYDNGIYKCRVRTQGDGVQEIIHRLIVKEASLPRFAGISRNNSEMLVDLRTDRTKTVPLECLAEGWPIPEITWRKNHRILIEDDRYKLSRNNSVLEIKNFSESDGGRYTCHVTNRFGEVQKYTDIRIARAETYVAIWPIVSVAVVSFVVVIAWMSYRKRREMASRRRFMEATLQRFNAGALDCLDPELNMAEQAELLPYNKKWEFPRELLKFGKELGSGAFGVVRLAEAKSICRSEAVTTVAVTVVRSTANLNHMTALQRELKILAYLGKHLNVVNLLGACTKRVSFGQLLVIVEFCRFGNLRDYLVRHRADFVTQTANVTEDIDEDSSDGEDLHTANDNGVDRVNCNVSSESADFSRGTDSTDRSTAMEDRVPEPDPLQQARRTNYQGDYEDDNLEPISTRDLLSWAWQVARGMKFLGLRRVLHGDLAARNILLADHNVVKICDFGLAKALFDDDNYQKRGNDPLPYKWMAIESLKDRIFSVHSDVWSYGVVLWEFYSLAKTPYSGMRPETLCEKLAEGFRMVRPEHATSEIYQIMLHCWNAEPFQRPSFAKLVEDIGYLMEDSVKTHYFDLDASYVRMTANASEHEEPDFLTMKTSEVILNPNEQA